MAKKKVKIKVANLGKLIRSVVLLILIIILCIFGITRLFSDPIVKAIEEKEGEKIEIIDSWISVINDSGEDITDSKEAHQLDRLKFRATYQYKLAESGAHSLEIYSTMEGVELSVSDETYVNVDKTLAIIEIIGYKKDSPTKADTFTVTATCKDIEEEFKYTIVEDTPIDADGETTENE